jgi:hypothetical protein
LIALSSTQLISVIGDTKAAVATASQTTNSRVIGKLLRGTGLDAEMAA